MKFNFKKAFVGFFAALAIFLIVGAASGNIAVFSRIFSDSAGTFRFFGHLFALTFIGLVFAWAYTKVGKKDKGGEQA